MRFYVTRGRREGEKEEREDSRWPHEIRVSDTLWAEGVSSNSPKGAVTIVTSRSYIFARPIDADWLSRYADSESKTRRVRGFPGTPWSGSEKSSNHLEGNGARYTSLCRNNADLNAAAILPCKEIIDIAHKFLKLI